NWSETGLGLFGGVVWIDSAKLMLSPKSPPPNWLPRARLRGLLTLSASASVTAIRPLTRPGPNKFRLSPDPASADPLQFWNSSWAVMGEGDEKRTMARSIPVRK